MERYLSSLAPEYRNKAGVFLCTAGSARMLVNNRLFEVKPGMIYVVSPLVSIHRVSQSDDFGGIHILDEMEVFYDVIHTVIDTVLRLKLRDSPCVRINERQAAFIQARRQAIDEKSEALRAATSEEERTLIRQMVHLLEQEAMLEVMSFYFRTQTVDAQPVERGELVVYNFIYSLHAHFLSERSVAFYASEAQLSPGHFTAIVKQRTGRTPSDWIIAITISHSKLQLEKTKKSIKEIAAELSFPEQFTFRKYFKKYVGMPPRQYRHEVSRS